MFGSVCMRQHEAWVLVSTISRFSRPPTSAMEETLFAHLNHWCTENTAYNSHLRLQLYLLQHCIYTSTCISDFFYPLILAGFDCIHCYQHTWSFLPILYQCHLSSSLIPLSPSISISSFSLMTQSFLSSKYFFLLSILFLPQSCDTYLFLLTPSPLLSLSFPTALQTEVKRTLGEKLLMNALSVCFLVSVYLLIF